MTVVSIVMIFLSIVAVFVSVYIGWSTNKLRKERLNSVANLLNCSHDCLCLDCNNPLNDVECQISTVMYNSPVCFGCGLTRAVAKTDEPDKPEVSDEEVVAAIEMTKKWLN